jgi:hypothetical protein
MEALHRWLWATFGGSAMLWDVALGVFVGATLIAVSLLALWLVFRMAIAVLEEFLDGAGQIANGTRKFATGWRLAFVIASVLAYVILLLVSKVK